MSKYKTKFSLKSLIAIVLAVLTCVGLVVGIVSLTKSLTSPTKEISPTFVRGGLNVAGEFVETNETIVTKEYFECQGLKIVKDFNSTVKYQVFFYDENKTLVEHTEDLTADYEKPEDINAKYAHIVIKPTFTDGKEKVEFWEVSSYARALTITVNRTQKYESDNVETTSYEVAFYDRDLIGRYKTDDTTGKLFSFPSNPVKTNGWSFIGWYSEQEVEVTQETVFTANTKVYAVYVKSNMIYEGGDVGGGGNGDGGEDNGDGGEDNGDENGENGGNSGNETPDNPNPSTPECEHRDADDNGLCDKCGIEFNDGNETPDNPNPPTPECEHRDADDNGLCDKCGVAFNDGNENPDTPNPPAPENPDEDNSCVDNYLNGEDNNVEAISGNVYTLLNHVGYGAFSNCDKLRSITFYMGGVPAIEATAFEGCSSLEFIKMNCTYEEFMENYGDKIFECWLSDLDDSVRLEFFGANTAVECITIGELRNNL